MAISTEWKPAEVYCCRRCDSENVFYRIVEDDECHEDVEYQCQECGFSWWIEGADY